MKTRVYLMRHGQTRFNAQSRIQGACDSPLTDEGIKQALSAAEYFKAEGTSFDKVYSSTQERATDTAELVSSRTDIIRLKGIKEMDFGAFEGQQEYLNPPLQGDIGYGDYFKTYGGEGYMEVRERMAKTIREVVSENEGQTLLMVSHGGAIAQFYRHVISNPPQVRMRNCAILTFDIEGGEFDLLSIYDPVNKELLYENKWDFLPSPFYIDFNIAFLLLKSRS